REDARGFIGQADEADELENVARLVANAPFFRAHRAAPKPGVPEPLAGLSGRHQHEILEHRHAAERTRDLESPHQAFAGDAVIRQLIYSLTVKDDLSAAGPDGASQNVEQGGLAGAIGADQA